MKPIKFILIAIFLFGILATGFVTVPATKRVILLQSAESNASPAQIQKAADVIAMRMKDFGTESFDVKAVPGCNQIRVALAGDRELKMIKSLITQKGMLSFYKTYDPQSLMDLLKDEKSLVNLLSERGKPVSSDALLCTSSDSTGYFDRYLESSQIAEKCRFAWSNFTEGQVACLYALQTEEASIIPLSGSDIESFEAIQDAQGQKHSVKFRFRKPAVEVWADVTRSNSGKAIAIVMDGKVLFAPVVQSEITGGSCEISGDFTRTDVRVIAALGNSGPLPVSLVIIQ